MPIATKTALQLQKNVIDTLTNGNISQSLVALFEIK